MIIARFKHKDEDIVIKQYPNGLYYNHYSYNKERDTGNCIAGGYDSLAEAERMVYQHRPLAKKEG